VSAIPLVGVGTYYTLADWKQCFSFRFDSDLTPSFLVSSSQYIDLNYQGGGIGEYQFYDATNETWDVSTCETHGNGRCAKMDCHSPDTKNWTLLGVYKEAFYASEWFEQLFKHAGYCLWDSNTYEFMHSRYGSWPEGCVDTGKTDEKGNELYLDVKPVAGGNVTVALYTDSICRTEYTGNQVSVEDAAGDKYVVGDNLRLFNDGMEVYKVSLTSFSACGYIR
jgi:hypothetical protein